MAWVERTSEKINAAHEIWTFSAFVGYVIFKLTNSLAITILSVIVLLLAFFVWDMSEQKQDKSNNF